MLSDEIKAEQAALRAEMGSYRARGLPVPMELWRRVGDVQVRLARALRAEGSKAAPDEGPAYRFRVGFDCTEPVWRRIKAFLAEQPTRNRSFACEAIRKPPEPARGEAGRGSDGEGETEEVSHGGQ